MKRAIILAFTVMLLRSNSFAMGRDENIYLFPIETVTALLKDCELAYKDYYPASPFPEKYQTLSKRRKLHFCMKKIMETGDVHDSVWWKQTNMRNVREQEYEREISSLPDDYFLIESNEDKNKFLQMALDDKYKQDEEKKRQQTKSKMGWFANVIGIFNPVIGLASSGAAAVQ